MAEQADAPEREDDELLLDDAAPGQEPEAEEDEEDAAQDDETDDQSDGDEAEAEEDELEVTFGDEAAPASEGSNSDLVRHLRAEVRKRDERLAAIERGEVQPQPQKIEVGEKPTLEACDWDADRFETELTAYQERKRQADEANALAQKSVQAEQEFFASKLASFAAKKTALKARDFEVAEEAVVATLSQPQQAALIIAADDSAALIYALGRHPEKLKALAATQNPIEFTKQLVKLEGTLKVTRATRTPPDPDRPIRGSAPLAHGTDKTLERLEREAARTGDRTKVVQHKRALKAQGK